MTTDFLTPTNVLFVVALAGAMLGAARGNGTAWAMIVGSGLTAFLTWREVPFDAATWILVDLAVIASIVAIAAMHRGFTVTDVLVVALFPPSWWLYPNEAQWAATAIDVIVSAQLLLTVPWAWLRLRWRATGSHPKDRTNGFSRVAHG